MVMITTDHDVRSTGRKAKKTRAVRAGYVPPFYVVTEGGKTWVRDSAPDSPNSPFWIYAEDDQARKRCEVVCAELNQFGEIREAADA